MAGALLNIGLYFLLFFFAALVAGIVCGFFLLNLQKGTLSGFLAALIAFLPFFILLEIMFPQGADTLSIIGASLILSMLGAPGGAIGSVLGQRVLKP